MELFSEDQRNSTDADYIHFDDFNDSIVLQTTEKKAYEFNLLLDAEDRFLVFDFSKLQLASSGRASTIRNPVLRQLIKGSASNLTMYRIHFTAPTGGLD